MTHHRLRLLHCGTADLCAHSALLHLTGRHLNLGGERSSHSSRHSGGRPRGGTPIRLQLSPSHARGCPGVLRELSMHGILIISVCARRARSSRCGHGCCLCWRHAVRLGHAGHVALLCVSHLLRMLLVLCASLAIALRREDWRCLLIRMHLLLLRGRGYRRISRSRILRSAVWLDVPGRVPVVGLLVLRVIGHGRNMLLMWCGCTRQVRRARLEGGVVVGISPNAPLADNGAGDSNVDEALVVY